MKNLNNNNINVNINDDTYINEKITTKMLVKNKLIKVL